MNLQNEHFIIIGTAGHVDHGKSSLIRRLTGTDPDRLEEERRRGLTIDLGFACFDLPDGSRCGIVDVPGHERFIKNMLAGATGIDAVLLVVAADEGVMPQTREHLDILDILGMSVGVVAITKVDVAEPQMVELVSEDVREALAATSLAGSPLVAVSSVTGEGFDRLRELLGEAAAQVEPRDTRGPARLPIDRVFTVKGHGTVVTGSLVRGRLAVDQQVEIVPGGLVSRVRSIEMYGSFVEAVAAPVRCGVNLAGLSTEAIGRGDQVIAPGSMTPAHMLDVRLRLTRNATRPLRYRERVRIHHGTSEILGRVVLLEGEALARGEDMLAQLRLEAPVAAARGDHFVIRRYSPAHTIGGGVVLDPAPRKHRRTQAQVISQLEDVEIRGEAELVSQWVRGRGIQPFSPADAAAALQLELPDVQRLLAEIGDEVAGLAGVALVSRDALEELGQRIVATLAQYHNARPALPAMPAAQLGAAAGRPPQAVLEAALAQLGAEGQIAPEVGGWRLAAHAPQLSEAQSAALKAAMEAIVQAALAPPERGLVLGLLAKGGAPEDLLDGLVRSGQIIIIADLCFSVGAIAEARAQLAALFAAQGPFSAADARDALGSSRKYVIPLLEHLDSRGFTRRQGDLRVVVSA